MKFNCPKCDYKTNDKSNYNKHTSRNKCISLPPIIELPIELPIIQPIDKNYTCKFCDGSFKRMSNLTRHLKICSQKTIVEKEKDIEINALKYQLQESNELIKELKEFIKSGKAGNTYNNISIKNCIKQNYPDAPPLEGITDYQRIKYDNDNDTNTNDDDQFISIIVYNHIHNSLQKYIGDFIIKCYKKDDPSQQSMWNSDVSRLTYIIKELLANNNSTWNHDYKGVKIKASIINPLLQYIKETINQFWISSLGNMKNMELNKLIDTQEKLIMVHEIKRDIENSELSNKIIKYIAPHFYMDNTFGTTIQ
jgi:hypothetical protein